MTNKTKIATIALAFLLPVFLGTARAAPPDEKGGWKQFSVEDRSAFLEARIAALKAGLKLTPSQEKNWPQLDAALRDAAKAREAAASEWRDRMKAHEANPDVIEIMRHRAKAMEARAAQLTKLSEAAKPLYDSLDEAQRHRFGILMRAVSHGHGGGHGGGWDRGNQRHG